MAFDFRRILKRPVQIIFAGSIVFGLAGAASWASIVKSSTPRIYNNVESVTPVNAALVLGTSRLLNGKYENPFFTHRIESAATLYKAGKVKFLIVSGNQAQGGHDRGGYDEPTDMRNALIAAGVPEAAIYRDYAGFRTLDSVIRAKSIFGQDQVIVVSQRFHLERALYLADRHGLVGQGFEAADIPARYAFKTYLREFGARILAVTDIWTGREPKFGGEHIELGKDAPT